jgi:isopenicillin N synthase-like dioxygenase
MAELPIIDFEPFLSMTASAQQKRDVASSIDDACRTHGFFYLRGHGVAQHLVNDIRELGKQFFDEASDAEKAELAVRNPQDGGDNARGYQKFSHPERGSHEVESQTVVSQMFGLIRLGSRFLSPIA